MPTYIVTLTRWAKFETSVEVQARTKEGALAMAADLRFLEDALVSGIWEVVANRGTVVSGAYRRRPGGERRIGRFLRGEWVMDIKQTEAYHDGFFAALDDVLPPDGSSLEFIAGWNAATEAKAILKGQGFHQNGRDFSKTTVIPRGRQ